MNRKFTRTIGTLTFDQQHNFFWGYINGQKVSINEVRLKDGSVKWFVKEELDVYEIQEKNTYEKDVQF